MTRRTAGGTLSPMTVSVYMQRKNLGLRAFARAVKIPVSVAARARDGKRISTDNGRKIVEGTRGEVTSDDMLGVKAGGKRKAREAA